MKKIRVSNSEKIKALSVFETLTRSITSQHVTRFRNSTFPNLSLKNINALNSILFANPLDFSGIFTPFPLELSLMSLLTRGYYSFP